jgi:hypothetical protein
VGGSLHFVYLPDLPLLEGERSPENHDRVLALAAEVGLDVIDLFPDFEKHPSRGRSFHTRRDDISSGHGGCITTPTATASSHVVSSRPCRNMKMNPLHRPTGERTD